MFNPESRVSARPVRWRFCLLLSAVVACASAASGAAVPANARLVVRASQTVSVFQGPATGYAVVAVLRPGDQVTLREQRFGWILVGLDNGKAGWVYSRWLAPAPPETTVQDTLREAQSAREKIAPEVQREAQAERDLAPPKPEAEPAAEGAKSTGAAKARAPRRPAKDDPDHAARVKALAEKLAEFNAQQEAPRQAAGPETARGEVFRLAKIAGTDPDPAARRRAATDLGGHGVAAAPVLVNLLDATDAGVQVEAATQLGRVGGALAVDGLMKAVARADAALPVKIAAVEALATRREARALPLLREQLANSADPAYQSTLRKAIAALGGS